MEIKIKHFDGQYPSFNISLHRTPDSDPFLEIKGCRIVDGKNGPFISYPSRKDANGKYWNHVYGGEAFNAAVLAKAQGMKPKRDDAVRSRQLAPKSGFDDMEDAPF